VRRFVFVLSFFILHSSFFICAQAQNVVPKVGERIFVKGGIAETSVQNKAGVNLGAMTPDSLYRFMAAIDSLRGDGVRFNRTETDSLVTALIDRTSPTGDSLDEEQMEELVAERKQRPLNPSTVRRFMDDRSFLNRYIDNGADTLLAKLIPPDTLTKREKRRLARLDSTAYRYNNVFRDSIKLSPVIAISMIVPGFSQLYNEDYWKIPIVYSTVAAGIGLYVWQTKLYRPYKAVYDYHLDRPVGRSDPGYDRYVQTMTDLQINMQRHNTYRQLAIGFSVVSYLYALVDGTLNYKGYADDVKRATTLATVFPGAGQVYNKTYWKLPIVIGGAAALIYCVDWNNRGYQRFSRAYNARTDGDPNTVDEFSSSSSISDNTLLEYKNSYRRNRDLCIILTGLFYFVQLIDAHATAHMKTYDISDDLTQAQVRFEPMMDSYYSQRMRGEVRSFGFSLNVTF
jgi:hypothetical protein